MNSPESVTVPSVTLLYAFRYALGRKTYAVGDVACLMIEHQRAFRSDWKRQVVDEIEMAINSGAAGDFCDVQEWRKVQAAFNAK